MTKSSIHIFFTLVFFNKDINLNEQRMIALGVFWGSPDRSGELSEVERSQARSKLPHRLSRTLSDFVTLCLKCSDGSIKEAARASGTQKVNNTWGSRVTSFCWSLSLTSLLFHTPEGHTHCVQHQHEVLLYSIFVYMSMLLFRVACILLLLCYYPQLSLEGVEGLNPVRYL